MTERELQIAEFRRGIEYGKELAKKEFLDKLMELIDEADIETYNKEYLIEYLSERMKAGDS